MMPELGKYASAVLSSYGISLALLVLLVAVSVRRSRKVKAELARVETKGKANG